MSRQAWDIFDKYFNSGNNFISNHHIESFNHFVDHTIPYTIKTFNPIQVIKHDPNDPSSIKHKIEAFIGGEDGQAIYYDKPTLYDSESSTQRFMYPNEARLMDYTYACDIYADVLIKAYHLEEGDKYREERKTYTHVKLGSLPIMLQSKLCVLSGMPPEVRKEMGECSFCPGGYFIVDGKEKVIVAQEMNITNFLFVNAIDDPKYSHHAFIRCTSAKTSVFPKTIEFNVYGASFAQGSRKNAITVSIPHIKKEIPLFLLFRALGVESDKDIMEHIMMAPVSNDNTHMQEFLRSSAMDGNVLFKKREALKYLSTFVPLNTVEHVLYIIDQNLFPNLETTSLVQKAIYLGYLSNILIRNCLGVLPDTDRDNYTFKRVGISGFMMGDIFKDYYNAFRVHCRNTIDNQYEVRHWNEERSLIEHINANFKTVVFQSNIIADGMIKSLKGSWGLSKKQGIVQDLNRISYMGFISHLRRVNTPIEGAAVKLRRPHQLSPTQYGMVCPSESPDGASIGLLKTFSMMCHVSFDGNADAVLKTLEPFAKNITNIESMAPVEMRGRLALTLNHTYIGCVEEESAMKICKWIRLLRRNGLINPMVSVSCSIPYKKLNISTDSGRCCRPLLIVEGNKLLSEVRKDVKYKSWNMYLSGITAPEEYDITYAGYRDPFTMGLKGANKKTITDVDTMMEYLEQHQGVIEFLDVSETNTCMLAMYPSDINRANTTFTHCEIHPSTMFSMYTSSIPLANYNAPTRIVFSGAQGKQAIGVYASNFNNRIDTMSYVLHYPQKPIIKTRFNDYVNGSQLPNGENLIVAVCTYSGYNQEDSIIVNKRAIEKGMFNLSYFKCYSDQEEDNPKTGERVIFANRNKLVLSGASMKLKPAVYDKIDDNGMPKVGSQIREGHAIVGKVVVKREVSNDPGSILENVETLTYKDKTEIADKTIEGTVDKVLMFKNNMGAREVKIKLRKFRVPEFGDKLASRCGQKGVVGMILPHEDMPFTQDGIVPDIIINPHAFPSRMTVGQMFETVLGKLCCKEGVEYDAMPFEDHAFEKMFSVLEDKYDMNRHGDEIMYDGLRGMQISTEVFIGPTYYYRLKHMVADKMNYRTAGRVVSMTKQPTKGRGNEGGLRIGEMETNVIISHGMSSFIKESFFERSDKYNYFIDENGEIASESKFSKRVMAPYAMKLLTQELQTMAINPRYLFTRDDEEDDDDAVVIDDGNETSENEEDAE